MNTDTAAADVAVLEKPSELLMLDLALIARSRTNPRTHFDEALLAELAESIRKHGLASPILVRPLPGDRVQDTAEDRQSGEPLPTHEIIAGERRWRACKLAGLTRIPVLVRHLDDKAVLELQLVENLKRSDLHPLEEAEGFQALMDKHGMSVEDIAAKVDKSASQIYVTLKLLDLTPECREQMYAGSLNRSLALLVARAPAELQARIAKDIMTGQYGERQEPMSYREAKAHIQQHYMLQLGAAVFDIKDPSLVPAAGACGDCQKRTGANRQLFGDIDHADTCTDPKCFDAKKVTHHALVAAKAKAAGKTVIQGKEAAELVPYRGATPKGYKLLDERDYTIANATTLRRALGKEALEGVKTVLIVDPHTKETREALPASVAGTLLAKATKQKAAAKSAAEKNKEPSKDELRRLYEERWLSQAFTQLHQAITSNGAADVGNAVRVQILRHVAKKVAASLDVVGEGEARLAELLGVGKVGWRYGFSEYFEDCPEDAIAPALMLLVAAEDLALYLDKATLGTMVAEEVDVNLQDIRTAVQGDMKAEAAQRAADAKAKVQPDAAKPAAKGGKKPAKPKTTAAEASAGIAKALQEQDGDPEEQSAELAPAVGARVRVRDDARGPNGKFRKIRGLEGVLSKQCTPDGQDWMIKIESVDYRIDRNQFEVLRNVETGGVLLHPQAAWPFPPKLPPKARAEAHP
jgi:ParB/RepB/Spo0J family partition protein